MRRDRAVWLAIASLCCSLVLFAVGRTNAAAAPFTIVALPDTQRYAFYDATTATAAMFRQQTQWIVNNLAAQNIVFVTHEGDIVQSGGAQPVEWQRADEAMDLLDGKVPYSTVAGNHDYEAVSNRGSGTTTYRSYFGTSRYQSYSWFGGASSNGLNTYQVFQAGDWQFLHLALELEVPNSAITWAQGVIDAHPGLPTIVTTHAYLDDANGCTAVTEFSGNSCQQIWNKLIKNNRQIFMVLNGHFDGDDGERHLISTNAFGEPVFQMVANYQNMQDYDGGKGYLRLLRFDPASDQISVRTYSPSLNQYLDDADSTLTFTVDFSQRFAATPPPTPTPSATRTPTPTRTPAPTPTSTPAPTPLPGSLRRGWLPVVTNPTP